MEAKRLTASVHYRQVQPGDVPALKTCIEESVDPFQFEVRHGQHVFEIRPRLNWNKGDAVEWILEKSRACGEQAICIGDDETDEDMFRRLPEGINIRIQDFDDAATAAPYCIRRAEVASFLRGILDVIHGMSGNPCGRN